MTRRRTLHELPERTCRYGERCLICLGRIEPGERYRDGGWPRRAHLSCAADVAAGLRREPSRAEHRALGAAEEAVSQAKGLLIRACATGDSGRVPGPEVLSAAEQLVERLKATWARPEGAEELERLVGQPWRELL